MGEGRKKEKERRKKEAEAEEERKRVKVMNRHFVINIKPKTKEYLISLLIREIKLNKT
jgi:5-deoxy-D-glucuronate isomerase